MRPGERLFRELDNIDTRYIEEGFTNMKSNKKYKIGIAAGILAVVIALPNVSPAFAKTLSEVPLIGKIFEVVTIIDTEEKSGDAEVDIAIPKIDNEMENPSVEVVNDMMEEYSERLIEQFYEDVNESRGSLDVDYEVVTNSETWFTIVIESVEIQASGYERKHYYNIDKKSGEYILFSGLFTDFIKSKDIINENIISQMRAKMEDEDLTYFIKKVDNSGFESVSENQNYYFNESNELVVSFDEYEVAPGYMGVVEFVIPSDLIE